MHYLDEGKGDPVVLVHGNPSWSFMYRKVVGAFKGSFRVLAFDHLGMGLSERPSRLRREGLSEAYAELKGKNLPDPSGLYPDRRQGQRASLLGASQSQSRLLSERIADFGYFMDKVSPRGGPVRLVGHDWGGPVALGWAVQNPERVKSVVLMNTGVRIPPGWKLPLRLALFKKLGPLGDFLIRDLGLFNYGILRQGTVRPLSPPAASGLYAPYHKSSLRDSVAAFVKDIPLSKDHPSYGTLRSIETGLKRLSPKPILLIWGMRDFVFGPRFLYDLKKLLPQSKILALPHSGHWALEDEPGKILRALGRFWRPRAISPPEAMATQGRTYPLGP
jgi:haloalkane dehalogenase